MALYKKSYAFRLIIAFHADISRYFSAFLREIVETNEKTP